MQTLDIDECAAFLHINATTASELAASGVLPGAKIGRAWVFLKDDLVEYVRGEVRRQQAERQKKNQSEIKPKIEIANVDPVSAFPAIRQKSRARRTPLPDLTTFCQPG